MFVRFFLFVFQLNATNSEIRKPSFKHISAIANVNIHLWITFVCGFFLPFFLLEIFETTGRGIVESVCIYLIFIIL